MTRVTPKSRVTCSKKAKKLGKSPKNGKIGAEDESKASGPISKWLQWGLFLLCLAAFIINSKQNLSKFMDSSTMVSESLWWATDRQLPFPAMTLCRAEPPVGDGSISDEDLRIEDLLDCSQHESEMGCMQEVTNALDHENPLYINFSAHKITYTRYRGKCFTLTTPFKVSPLSYVGLILKPQPLLIYLHEPGEEFFIHWSWFPTKMAPYVHVQNKHDLIFASLTKSELEDREGCKPWSLEEQIECLKRNIKKAYLASGPNCTTPWLNSILMPNPLDRPICKTFEDLEMDYLTIDGNMAKHMASTCPMPCRQTIFDLSVEYFTYNPSDLYLTTTTGEKKEVYIDYSTTVVKKRRSLPIASINDFVSSIGGNLGLFLDFSVISVLYVLARKFQSPRKRRPRMMGR